jgi:hypothetical protein
VENIDGLPALSNGPPLPTVTGYGPTLIGNDDEYLNPPAPPPPPVLSAPPAPPPPTTKTSIVPDGPIEFTVKVPGPVKV